MRKLLSSGKRESPLREEEARRREKKNKKNFAMDPADCALEICPIEDAYIHYQPTIAGNSVYLALFGVLLIAQAILAPVYRTWGFSGSMVAGLVLEVLGYVARILFHDDPFNFDYFLMYFPFLSKDIYKEEKTEGQANTELAGTLSASVSDRSSSAPPCTFFSAAS